MIIREWLSSPLVFFILTFPSLLASCLPSRSSSLMCIEQNNSSQQSSLLGNTTTDRDFVLAPSDLDCQASLKCAKVGYYGAEADITIPEGVFNQMVPNASLSERTIVAEFVCMAGATKTTDTDLEQSRQRALSACNEAAERQ